MEAKHTQGPLKAVRNSSFWELVTPWPDETLEEAGKLSTSIAYIWGDTEEQASANARRLAACWNACDGIPTEALEDGSARAERDELREMTGGTFYEIKKQRDELLAALDRLAFAAQCRDNTSGDHVRLIAAKAELAAASEQATSLISSVKG